MTLNDIKKFYEFAYEPPDNSNIGANHIHKKHYTLNQNITIIDDKEYLCGLKVSKDVRFANLEAMIKTLVDTDNQPFINETFCPNCKNKLLLESPSFDPHINYIRES